MALQFVAIALACTIFQPSAAQEKAWEEPQQEADVCDRRGAGEEAALLQLKGPKEAKSQLEAAAAARRGVDVFYHIYQHNQTLTSIVVAEQLKTILEAGALVSNVFYTTIGGNPNQTYDCPICRKVMHKESGDENETQQILYEHCLASRSEVVAYIHAKGTYHPSDENDLFRRMLMKGAITEPCLRMPSACDVCGARWSAAPHEHYPGNMWVARCSHIRRLHSPTSFPKKMAGVMAEREKQNEEQLNCRPWCNNFGSVQDWYLGLGRFAAEHWVTSHPKIHPCDTYPGRYTSGYSDLPREPWTPTLMMGPRFPLWKYFQQYSNAGYGGQLLGLWTWRLFEWRVLYQDSPKVDSWANGFYNSSREQ